MGADETSAATVIPPTSATVSWPPNETYSFDTPSRSTMVIVPHENPVSRAWVARVISSRAPRDPLLIHSSITLRVEMAQRGLVSQRDKQVRVALEIGQVRMGEEPPVVEKPGSHGRVDRGAEHDRAARRHPALRAPILEQRQEEPVLALDMGGDERPDGAQVGDHLGIDPGGRMAKPARGVGAEPRDGGLDLAMLEARQLGGPRRPGDARRARG